LILHIGGYFSGGGMLFKQVPAMAVLTAVSISSLGYLLGGWAWFLVAIVSMLCVVPFVKEPLELAATSWISLVWLMAFVLTEDRRLFFPFTIQFAVQALGFWTRRSKLSGILAAFGVVALFTAIRLAQSATMIVLLVELLVAGIAIWVAREYYCRRGKLVFAASIGSLLAFAGLVF